MTLGNLKNGALALTVIMCLSACATTSQQTSSTRTAFGYSQAYGLHGDISSQVRSILATLGENPSQNVSYQVSQARRVEIAGQASRRPAAHETEFAFGAALESKIASPLGESANGERQILIEGAAAGGWLEEEQTYRHTLSGMTCDKGHLLILEGIEEPLILQLNNIRLFQEDGLDTACDYKAMTGNVYFTIYASKWPDVSLEQHFGERLKLIVDRFQIQSESEIVVVHLDSEEEANHSSTIEGETRAAAYLLEPQNGVTMKTMLLLNKTGDWHVKARATFEVNVVDEKAVLAPTELLASVIHQVTLVEVDKHINSGVLTQVRY